MMLSQGTYLLLICSIIIFCIGLFSYISLQAGSIRKNDEPEFWGSFLCFCVTIVGLLLICESFMLNITEVRNDLSKYVIEQKTDNINNGSIKGD